jgi:hypothetical protein
VAVSFVVVIQIVYDKLLDVCGVIFHVRLLAMTVVVSWTQPEIEGVTANI